MIAGAGVVCPESTRQLDSSEVRKEAMSEVRDVHGLVCLHLLCSPCL